MSESDTERRLAGQAVITAITVMSRSRSQGSEVTIVTGDVPSRAFMRHHGETLRYGNAIQSHRERGYGLEGDTLLLFFFAEICQLQ